MSNSNLKFDGLFESEAFFASFFGDFFFMELVVGGEAQ